MSKDEVATGSRTSQKQGIVTTLIVVALLIPVALLSPWILSLVLIFSCAIYVAFEFALVKVPVHELEKDHERGVAASGVLLKMKREMNAMLAACQFGITLTSLGLTLALEPAIHHALEAWGAIDPKAAPAIAMTIGAFFHVTFGELVPKGLALVVPRRVLYVTAPFMRMFRVLAVPFIKTCNTIASWIVKALTGKHPDTDAHEEGLEIDEALKVAQAQGQIAPSQLRLMRNVLTFADRTAREVMTPSSSVILLDLTKSWEENSKLAEEHGYSRFPIIRGTAHDVVGYVRRAELLKAELQGKRNLAALVRPIERRPETAPLTLLNLFKGAPMIALYDEHGSFSGLLTAEDVIEQIVGEVYDETDDIAPPPSFEPDAHGNIEVDGSVLLDEAAEKLKLEGLEDEHGDVDTIGGLVLKKLAREPAEGDSVDLGRYTATVSEAQGFRIKRITLTMKAVPEDEEGSSDIVTSDDRAEA